MYLLLLPFYLFIFFSQHILWFILQKSKFLLMSSHFHLNKRQHALRQYMYWLVGRALKQQRWLLCLYCNFEIILQTNRGLAHFVPFRTPSCRFLWKLWKRNTFEASVSLWNVIMISQLVKWGTDKQQKWK